MDQKKNPEIIIFSFKQVLFCKYQLGSIEYELNLYLV